MTVTRTMWRGRAIGLSTTLALMLTTVIAGGSVSALRDRDGANAAVAHPAVGPAHTATGSASGKPTIVLVHGAFAGASGWNTEIRRLSRRGYPVIAPANPLRGLTSDADYIRSVLATIAGPIVLVGHSYGGAVITNAARGVESVKALVYVAAFVPDEGESIQTAYDGTTYPGSLLGPDTTELRPAPNPVASGGQDLDIYIKASRFRQVFAADQSASRALVMAATQRPLSLTANTEASAAPAWRSVPSWDLITLDDKAIAPGGQRFMAHRAHAHISTVRSAHDVMVSHPAAVVRTVLAAVHSVS